MSDRSLVARIHRYISSCVLGVAGVLLIAGGVFCFALGIAEPHGRHGGGGLVTMSLLGAFQVADGIGLLMPQIAVRLCAALLLVVVAVYLFFNDAFRRENWWIYGSLVLPFLLTLSLVNNDKSAPMQGSKNAY